MFKYNIHTTHLRTRWFSEYQKGEFFKNLPLFPSTYGAVRKAKPLGSKTKLPSLPSSIFTLLVGLGGVVLIF